MSGSMNDRERSRLAKYLASTLAYQIESTTPVTNEGSSDHGDEWTFTTSWGGEEMTVTVTPSQWDGDDEEDDEETDPE
jgi:hypothetical protein